MCALITRVLFVFFVLHKKPKALLCFRPLNALQLTGLTPKKVVRFKLPAEKCVVNDAVGHLVGSNWFVRLFTSWCDLFYY